MVWAAGALPVPEESRFCSRQKQDVRHFSQWVLLAGFPEQVTSITKEQVLLALVKQQGGSLSICTG